MKRRLNHVAIALVSATLSCAALAGGDKETHSSAMDEAQEKAFSKLDTDQNGMVSQAEISQAEENANRERLNEEWSKLDANQDGQLDRAEFARFEPTAADGDAPLVGTSESDDESDREADVEPESK